MTIDEVAFGEGLYDELPTGFWGQDPDGDRFPWEGFIVLALLFWWACS